MAHILPPFPDELALHLAAYLTPRTVLRFRRVSRRHKYLAETLLPQTLQTYAYLSGSTLLLEYFNAHPTLFHPADVVLCAAANIKSGNSRMRAVFGATEGENKSVQRGRMMAGLCSLEKGDGQREEFMWRCGREYKLAPTSDPASSPFGDYRTYDDETGSDDTTTPSPTTPTTPTHLLTTATRLLTLSRLLRGFFSAHGQGTHLPPFLLSANLDPDTLSNLFRLIFSSPPPPPLTPADLKTQIVATCIALQGFQSVWEPYRYHTGRNVKVPYRPAQILFKAAGKDGRLMEELNYLVQTLPGGAGAVSKAAVDLRGSNPYRLPVPRFNARRG
ncbi:hypothetical protein HK104_003546 [Borealophlyctis nickersoniae]|nr:hypothetical protein HK104_003546 [Borealophlyctis nickersoniae]